MTLADTGQQARFRSLFETHGVNPARIELIPKVVSPADHLALYGRIDIGLDSFPYNGCTTTCDAFWMGVPVVTLAGCMSHGRYGVSLLSTLKLDELIATTPADYVAKAVGLAEDPKRLMDLRSALRPRMAASPLCDAKAFAQKVEQAYRRIWRRWCER
jgi:predicted O-linked N-acetylglucosamine transferase (SPINDLY family)